MMSPELQEVANALRDTQWFVFSKGDKYFLYRRATPSNVKVVHCSSIAGLKRQVRRVTGRKV